MSKATKRYINPDNPDASVVPSALKKMGKERQIEFMREWFGERYEDPTVSQPYDSEEGCYIYINGGPFDAREELENEFSSLVKEAALEELVEELEADCTDWTHTDRYSDNHPDFDDFYEVDASLAKSTDIGALKNDLNKMQQLLEHKDNMPMELHKFQLMMIFGFCITALEAYLSGVFARKVMAEDKLKERFLKNAMSDQKILLGDFYQIQKTMDATIKTKIAETTFHNLGRVKPLFKGVLSTDIGDIGELSRLIEKRHDFVHRGGKDKDGNEVTTTKAEVEALIAKIREFCRLLDIALNFDDLSAESPF